MHVDLDYRTGTLFLRAIRSRRALSHIAILPFDVTMTFNPKLAISQSRNLAIAHRHRMTSNFAT